MSGAVTWEHADGPRAANVGRDRPAGIGRAEGAEIRVTDNSVSRQQATIRFDGARFVMANLSRTNPTLLNGRPVEAEAPLSDGDELLLGAVRARFHDLGVHDTISGPICSHCGRENNATDRDCWFCGTSLVSAQSALRKRRHVVGRLVDGRGGHLDLYAGQSAVLAGDAPTLRQEATAHGEGMEVTASEAGLTAGGGRLSTGQVLEAGGMRYVVIVRA